MEHTHTNSPRLHNYNKAFAYGILLNVIYIVIEALYGILINSMALIADAGHNLSDVLGLLLAWGAAFLAKSYPTKERTYGMRKSTILSALFNSILLFIAVGAILIESIRKFISPAPVEGSIIMIVAGIGVIINGITAFLFMKGKDQDINIKGAYLHMAADAAISFGVVAAGFIILLTGWNWLDPVMSIIIVIVITIGTWGLLKESFHLSMDAVPKHIELEEVKEYLLSLPGVTEVHDLHIWGMSTTESALTAHIVKPAASLDDEFISNTCKVLHEKFGIGHTTIQIEKNNNFHPCGISDI